MTTQIAIAHHLGIDQSAVSRLLNGLGLVASSAPLDEVRIAYLRGLRAAAAEFQVRDGGRDLTHERVLSERVERELRQIQLEERRAALVSRDQLDEMIGAMVEAWARELRRRDEQLRERLEAAHGVVIDPEVVAAGARAALAHLERAGALVARTLQE